MDCRMDEKPLTPHQPEGEANTGSNGQAAHPLLAQVIQKALDLGRIIYAETCRQLSDTLPAETPLKPPAPAYPRRSREQRRKGHELNGGARGARARDLPPGDATLSHHPGTGRIPADQPGHGPAQAQKARPQPLMRSVRCLRYAQYLSVSRLSTLHGFQ